MNHLSDEEIMLRCVQGDRRAMDVLVSRYHGKLLDFAFRHLRNREAAADIAQTTLVRVFESAQNYRLKASFKTWIYTIALNLIRDECRKRKVRNESLASEMEFDPAGDAPSQLTPRSPEDEAIDLVSGSAIWRAVDELSENQRTAVALKFRQELTYEEIAEVMGAPSGTVKSWIHFALKILRKTLEPIGCD